MQRPEIQIKRLVPDLPLPKYQTAQAAACDLHAALESSATIDPQGSLVVPTGIAIALPNGYEAQIRPRSGLAFNHQISIVNSPATIDADYRGELKVILINHGKQPFVINRGDRIAQMIISQAPQAIFNEVSELDSTERGTKGLGSTGK